VVKYDLQLDINLKKTDQWKGFQKIITELASENKNTT
jgi:hypothetical protein